MHRPMQLKHRSIIATMRGSCVAGLLALLCAVASSQTKFIDVDGHRMYAKCAGSGGPTVVFDSGFGDGLDSWNPVFSSIARFAHVVAYDRAGYGQSAPGPAPRSMIQIARELHTL